MSDIKTIQWNSVVVGKWNPAILSPKGIADLIFDKPPDEPIEILVPLNAIGPFKVRIDGLLISADFDRLIIDCEKSDWEMIGKSREYCCKAIDALPKTPLTAAGFNIRYKLSDPDEHFTELLSIPLDATLSDNGLKITGRETRRSFTWNNGEINLHIVKAETGHYDILVNFNKSSNNNNELQEWLKTPINEVKNITKTIICTILDICEEDKIL